MRGKLIIVHVISKGDRITPADAGKTYMFFRAYATNRDHPRGCGENRPYADTLRQMAGSPPRMRGKHETELARHDRHGITPADAGKTTRLAATSLHYEDHPRGCGENNIYAVSNKGRIGSPPRMRGKHTR